MSWNRLVAAAVLVLFWLACFVTVVQWYRHPWDATAFKTAASRLLLAAGDLPPVAGEAHFLIEIEDREVRAPADVVAAVTGRSQDETVDVRLWDPSRDDTATVDIRVRELRRGLREISPAIVVTWVANGLPAQRAGVRTGDVIVGVDGPLSETFRDPDPLKRSLDWIESLTGDEPGTANDADYRIRRATPGDTLMFRVLRGEGDERVPVVLVARGFSYPMSVVLAIGLIAIALGSFWLWVLVRRGRIPAASIASLGYLLLVAFARRPHYDPIAVVHDLSVLLPFLAVAALRLPARPIWQPPERTKYRAARRRMRGELVPAASGLPVLLATLTTLVLMSLPAEFPGIVPSGLRERVLQKGDAVIWIFGALFAVFLFGLLHLAGIFRAIARTVSSTEAGNQEVLHAVAEDLAGHREREVEMREVRERELAAICERAEAIRAILRDAAAGGELPGARSERELERELESLESSAEALAEAVSGPGPRVTRSLFERSPNAASSYYGLRLTAVDKRLDSNAELEDLDLFVDDQIDRDEEAVSHSFAVLRWCEVSLPLLGFLGTVLGIAQALPQMSRVLRQEASSAAVTDALDAAFRDLGLAFDTTLAGLVGLLLVGVVHSFTRRRIAIDLAGARRLAKAYVALLDPPSTAREIRGVRHRLDSVNSALARLSERTAALENRSRDAQADRKLAGNAVRLLIDTGNEEPWREMRRVLNRPLVEFDRVEGLRERIEGALKGRGLEAWRFDAVASASGGTYAVVQGDGREGVARYLLRVELETQRPASLLELPGLKLEPPLHLAVSVDGRHAAIRGTGAGPVEIRVPATDDAAAETCQLPDLQGEPNSWWSMAGGAGEYLFYAVKGPGSTTVRCHRWGSTKRPVDVEKGLIWLDGSPSFDPIHDTLWAAEEQDAGQLLLVRYSLEKSNSTRGAEGAETFDLVPKGQVRLRGLKPRKLCPVTENRILIIPEDSEQPLHFADFEGGPVKPVVTVWDSPSRSLQVIDLHFGHGDWVAALESENSLSMWRLLPTGHLVPYRWNEPRKRYSIGGIGDSGRLGSSFASTRDGRHLVAVIPSVSAETQQRQDVLATWRFPVLSSEHLAGGARR